MSETVAVVNETLNYDEFIQSELAKINATIKTWNNPFDFSMEYMNHEDAECFDDDNSHMLGLALFSMQDDISILPVSINIPLFETHRTGDCMAWDEVMEEITVTLWHEAGHGLIQRINDAFEVRIEDDFDTDIEDVVEEFGRAQGDLNESKLGRYILKQKNENWETLCNGLCGEDDE